MNAYQDLPDITKVVQRGPADDALFSELASVLDKHGARDRFGITLLHTHFPIADGEVLLEETDVEARVQRIAPVTDRPARAIETVWRLGEDKKPVTICICPEDLKGNHLGRHISRGG